MPRLVLLLVLVLVAFAPTGYTVSTDPKSAVEQVLQTQQDAWNRHDLDAFMAGYWNSPDLTFFSDAKETSGWQATLDRYRTTYAGPGHEMGKLDFTDLRVEMLGREAAFVRGSWHLTMSDGKTPHGRFTLIFRKFRMVGKSSTTIHRRRGNSREECLWKSGPSGPRKQTLKSRAFSPRGGATLRSRRPCHRNYLP